MFKLDKFQLAQVEILLHSINELIIIYMVVQNKISFITYLYEDHREKCLIISTIQEIIDLKILKLWPIRIW